MPSCAQNPALLPLSRRTGVYFIRNLMNSKCYIGSASRSMAQRWADHKRQLNQRIHANPILQAAWNFYGQLAFEFQVLEDCRKAECLDNEQWWIQWVMPEYNVAKTVSAPMSGRKHTSESIAKMVASRTGLRRSSATKAKMSASLLGNQRFLGHKQTAHWHKRIREVNAGNHHFLGRRHTAASRLKCSEAKRLWWANRKLQLA